MFFLLFNVGDVPRVNGQLAVARAFGDKNLKAHLRVDPDVYCLLIQDTDEFLILASDGLWKVLKFTNSSRTRCLMLSLFPYLS